MPAFATIPILAAALTLLLAIYKILHLHFSPEPKIPNAHPLAAITSLWVLWLRFTKRENATVLEAFRKHGSVIRLAPNEIAINDVERGVKTIYSKNFDKPTFYSFYEFYGYDHSSFSSISQNPSEKNQVSKYVLEPAVRASCS